MQVKKKGDAQGCLETLSCLRHLLALSNTSPTKRREANEHETSGGGDLSETTRCYKGICRYLISRYDADPLVRK